MIDRRTLLSGAALLLGSGLAARAADLPLGERVPFDFAALKNRARDLARTPYAPPAVPDRDVLQAIDYEAHGKLKYKPDHALWADGPGAFPVTFFHLGRYFQKPVRMHVVTDGEAREIIYDPAAFEMPVDSPARRLPPNPGFAGFRFQESRSGALDWQRNDWVAFLGASYFRAIGELYQYGLSARGPPSTP